MRRLGKEIRWLIVRLLDRLPDTCWADLVIWATYPEEHPFGEIFEMRDRRGNCARLGLPPYCGKCDVLGRR